MSARESDSGGPARYDVVVMGGGAAGLSVGLTLRHHTGLSVLVLERSDYRVVRTGETLSPGAQGLLEYLRVWPAFLADAHQPSYSSRATWGDERMQTRDFILSPHGLGWHLDRARFDGTLARCFESAGGVLWRRAQLMAAVRDEDGWRLRVRRSGGASTVRARFVVDASGKAAAFGRLLGVKRLRHDRLAAVIATFQFGEGEAEDASTLVETYAGGWFYSAKQPGNRLVAALMSDSDLVHAGRLASPDRWQAALAQLPHSQARLQRGRMLGRLRVCSAHSGQLEQLADPGWLAVGDAATSHDPLSSSGIPQALNSGIHAGCAIHALLTRGDGKLLDDYQARMKLDFEHYRQMQQQYYAMEQRWSGAPFWARRHGFTASIHTPFRAADPR
ncbi:NAD(P)/FAD-dependent oxidoreductase [Chitinimonas arctica]|uniref:NAD(P)/FAD-dependent oxidoreductase n=1 Tax=Chitinimonas arctica TaxID=2594795 RepID=A0A516SEI4_9NEIS|nr:tryptophan 7-halogenase [Chitinimonas arctica]QDQ26577.1 NAD(P)/FAD-dependent oxidoreductase [Chitinimonas arctica]